MKTLTNWRLRRAPAGHADLDRAVPAGLDHQPGGLSGLSQPQAACTPADGRTDLPERVGYDWLAGA